MAEYNINVKLNNSSALFKLKELADGTKNIEFQAGKAFKQLEKLMLNTFRIGLTTGHQMFNGLIGGLQKLGGFFQSIFSNAIGLVQRLGRDVAVVVGAIGAATGKAVMMASERQRDLAAMARVGAGPNEIAQLRNIGMQPGGSINDAYKQYSRLGALGMGSKQSIDLISGLTKAGALGGSTQEELNRAVVGLIQMKAKGKVTGEELRGQIMEAVPMTSKVIKNEFGTTDINELNKVDIDTFIEKFISGLNKLENPAMTAFDAIKNLKQGFSELAISFGSGFMGADLTSGLIDFSKTIMDFIPKAKEMGEKLRWLVDKFIQFGEVIWRNRDAIVGFIENAWKRLTDSLDKFKKSDTWKAILEVWEKIKSVFTLDKVDMTQYTRGFKILADSMERIALAMANLPFDKFVSTFLTVVDKINSLSQDKINLLISALVYSKMPGGKSMLGQAGYQAVLNKNERVSRVAGSGVGVVVGAGIGAIAGPWGKGIGALAGLYGANRGLDYIRGEDQDKTTNTITGVGVGVLGIYNAITQTIKRIKLTKEIKQLKQTLETSKSAVAVASEASEARGLTPVPGMDYNGLGAEGLWSRPENPQAFPGKRGSITKVVQETEMNFSKISNALGKFANGLGKVLAVLSIFTDIYNGIKGKISKGEAAGGATLGALSFVPGPVGWAAAAANTARLGASLGAQPLYDAMYGTSNADRQWASEPALGFQSRWQRARFGSKYKTQEEKNISISNNDDLRSGYGAFSKSAKDWYLRDYLNNPFNESRAANARIAEREGAMNALKYKVSGKWGQWKEGMYGSEMVKDPKMITNPETGPSKERQRKYAEYERLVARENFPKMDIIEYQKMANDKYQEMFPNTFTAGNVIAAGGGMAGLMKRYTPPNRIGSGSAWKTLQQASGKNVNFAGGITPESIGQSTLDLAQGAAGVTIQHNISLDKNTLQFVEAVAGPAASQSLNKSMNNWLTSVAETNRL